jgi:uncharacterized protein (DUF1786 family)
MKILTIDIGTGTQDIFLYDSQLDLENGFKLVVPSPTMVIHQCLKQATRQRQAVLLTGVTMGGGPSMWAVEAHLRHGLPVYATPAAARSFNDDLVAVQAMGIHLVSEDEAQLLPASVRRLELRDFDFPSIAKAFDQFGVSLEDLAAIAVAVFDHGEAPPEISDRKFRFDYLQQRIQAENCLSAFAYIASEIPSSMTRLQAVAQSARLDTNTGMEKVPFVVMDSAPAAVLGATFDPQVSARSRLLVVNVGNFHTLAFRLGPSGIEGLFEHHTGLLDTMRLESLLRSLANGSLREADVFNDHGHGALVYSIEPLPLDSASSSVVVTGPRRNILRSSTLKPYFATPFGDMMLSGCFGLLAATADRLPELSKPILDSLHGQGVSGTPWDVD